MKDYLFEDTLPFRIRRLLTPSDGITVQRSVKLWARLLKLHHAIGAPGVGHRRALTLPRLQEERGPDEIEDGEHRVAMTRRSPEGDEIVQETHTGR